jgi:Right handed beta helix region
MHTLARNSTRTLVTAFCVGSLLSAQAFASTFYVDDLVGSDANSGLSPSQAWKSLGKVNATVRGTGDDVLLRSGRTFHNQSLSIKWAGTENDWINVGCYKLDTSGTGVECNAADPKPEINGTLEPQCAPSNTCLRNRSGAVPSNEYGALVVVRANYVAIKNLSLRDSAGKAVDFESNASQPRHHFILENIVATHMSTDILAIGSHYQHGIVRNVTGSEYGLGELYGYPEYSGGGWPGGIMVYDSPNAMILMENNLVHNGFGEGFNCLRSSHVVMRGNRAGNVHSNPYYLDHCSNSVVENNIAWGDLGGKWGANRAFAGVNIHNEDYGNVPTSRSSINNIVRNNLITGVGYCIDSGQFDGSVQRGLKIGFYFYGNTCVAVQRRNIQVYPTTNVDRILVQNNIFYSPRAMEGSCSTPNSSSIQFVSNLWDDGNVSSRCYSNTDLRQDPLLVNSLASFAQLNSTNIPRASHFALQANSPVLGNGNRIELGGSLSLVDLIPFNSLVKDERCAVSAGGLDQDFFCVDRRVPPSMGALDRSKYPPRAPVVISSDG